MDKETAGREAAEGITKARRKTFAKRGITDSYLAGKLKEELNANFQKPFCNEATDGKVILSPKLIAWEIRQKARHDAEEQLGYYPRGNNNHVLTGPGGGPLNIVFTEVRPKGQEILKINLGPRGKKMK